MNKNELASKLINNEVITPFYPEWESFLTDHQIPENIEEYKTACKILYNDIVLYKFANGESKPSIKQYIIDKIKMIAKYNSINEYDKILMYILTDLLNKYFAMKPTEHRQGIINNKQVNYSWNKVLKYNLIDPTKDKQYEYFQLQIVTDDWINHTINGQKTKNKFTVDPYNNIYLNEVINL